MSPLAKPLKKLTKKTPWIIALILPVAFAVFWLRNNLNWNQGPYSQFTAKDQTLTLTFPQGWQSYSGLDKGSTLEVIHKDRELFFMSFTELRGTSTHRTLLEFSQFYQNRIRMNLSLPKIHPSERLRMGEFQAEQFELSGDIRNERLHFLNTSIETPSVYIRMVFWCEASAWEKKKRHFQAILKTAKISEGDYKGIGNDPHLVLGHSVGDNTTFKVPKPGGYEVTVPKTWETRSTKEGQLISKKSLETNKFKPNLVIVPEVLSKSLSSATYRTASVAVMKRALTTKKYRLLKQDDIPLGPHQVGRAVYEVEFIKGHLQKNTALFFTHGNKGYVVTCSALKGQFQDFSRECLAVSKTLRFL